MESRVYVSDLIDNDYLQWKAGDKIIISTPTGSGKTTFVIDTLLKDAVAQNKHILYYCNRRVLFEQFSVQSKKLIEMVFGENVSISKKAEQHLHILTYQGSELTKSYPSASIKVDDSEDRIEISAEDVLYYVFDEAHYFVSDAQINSRTNFWYKANFEHGISLFLTATPKPLIAFLEGKEILSLDQNQRIYEECKKRDKLRKKTERIVSEILDTVAWECKQVNIAAKMPRVQELLNATIRRCYNPLNKWFDVFESAYNRIEQKNNTYWYKPDYSYVEPVYFREYEEIVEKIEIGADDKWLIFVDDEILGRDLARAIKERIKTPVAFVSSQTVKRSGLAQNVYGHIVAHKKSPDRVVVATSVMDCGIDLKDNQLKNIVIVNDDETGFLQMLGRKRAEDDERIQLYIKVFDYLTIHNRYNRCMQELQFMLRLCLKNSITFLKSGISTANRDGNTYGSVLIAKDLNKLLDEFPCYSKSALTIRVGKEIVADCNGHVKKREVYDLQNHELYLMEYDYSRTAFLGLLAKMYCYHQAISHYRFENEQFLNLCDHTAVCLDKTNGGAYYNSKFADYLWYNDEIQENRFSKFPFLRNNTERLKEMDFRSHIQRDDTFFLRYQLKWIGKEYDINCWCGYEERISELTKYLEEEAKAERWLREDDQWAEQSGFARMCMELILTLPIVPTVLQKDASRYERDPRKYPGKDKLNKCFRALSLPFAVTSAQRRYGGKKKTCWKLVKMD